MALHTVGLGLDHKYMQQYNAAIQALLTDGGRELTHISIVGIETRLEAKQFRQQFMGVPVIHHLSNVEPAGLKGLNVSRARELDEISKILRCAWCGEDIGVWCLNDVALPYFAPPLYTEEIAHLVARNVAQLQEISSVPFLAEIPSVGIVVGDLTAGRFFEIVAIEGGCDIVLDLSHVFSHAVALGQSWQTIMEDFPLERVVEVHVAGGFVRDGDVPRYIDTHSHAVASDVFDMLADLGPRLNHCRAITYEVGCNLPEEIFLTDLERLDTILSKMDYRASIDRGRLG